LKKLLISIILLASVLLILSCSGKKLIITSYNDGPYVFRENDQIKIISFNRLNNADTTLIDEELNPSFYLKCAFDSLSCPDFTFQLSGELASDSCIIDMPEKLIAVSDIEGNFGKFYKLLKSNNVIDQDYNWTFGKGILVIAGDLVDRGDYVTQCLWLAYHLDRQALKAGGKVYYLMGNHERMFLTGDSRYVSERYVPFYKLLNSDTSKLFSESSELGSWIRKKNAMLRAGNVIFVHGGLSPELLDHDLNIRKINSEMKNDFSDNEFETDESEFLFSGKGILWYRGLITDYKDYQKISPEKLAEVLDKYLSETVVIGHCVVDSVSADYSGRVIRIDVDHYERCQGLLIESGIFYLVDEFGKRRKLFDNTNLHGE